MFQAAIITASDKGSRGQREDVSGQVVKEILEKNGYTVVQQLILPDERQLLADEMRRLCAEQVDLILTTGGTGFSPRDWTPEASLDVIERQVPGIPEAMRMNSLQITKRAMLSRAVAGNCQQTLIINLPGSPKAVRENLEFIVTELAHGLEILRGQAQDCARP